MELFLWYLCMLLLLHSPFGFCQKNFVNNKLEKGVMILNLKKELPGWDVYSLDTSKDSMSSLHLSNLHEVWYQGLYPKDLDHVCVDSLSRLNSSTYSFLNGKTCFNFKRGNKEVLTAKYKLITDSHAFTANLTLIFQRQLYPIGVQCNELPADLVSLSYDGILTLDSEIRKIVTKNGIECFLFAHDVKHFQKKRLPLSIAFSTILMRSKRSVDSIAFEKEQYNIKVKENVGIGKTILPLRATGGSGNYIYAKNVNLNSDRLFLIEKNTGNLKVRERLNREDGPTQFVLDVTATDENNENVVAYTTVIIIILDVNDNYPIFKQNKYEKTIPEGNSRDQLILTVQATDSDEGINQQIEYSFVKDDMALCPFKIDAKTGVIQNIDALDRETKPYYIIKVRAEDQGVEPGSLSAEVLVNISLSDINDNKPQFSKSEYTTTILESTPVNTVLLTLNATDLDEGTNGEVEYQELTEPQFAVTKTGEIILKELLDFDRSYREFDFQVDVFDRGFTPQHANVRVKIFVEDVNDNAPRFTRRSYRTSILESVPVNSFVYNKLTARDIDSNENGRVSYSLASDTPQDLPFSLDTKTGAVKVIKPLDYEITKTYTFKVVASDHGTTKKTGTTSITVDIGNVNDNSPKFQNSSYVISISEDTRRGSQLIQVQAEDPDNLSVQDFEYSIAEGNLEGCFRIDAFSGNILLSGCKLDFKKMYNLKLKVVDLDADFDQKPGFASLVVNVFDANNNAPRFLKSVYSLSIPENVNNSTLVGSVTATDADSGENARITYSIVGSDCNFFINASTGQIYSNSPLDREKILSYKITVKAEDHGKPKTKSSTTKVIISLKDINDNSPQFIPASYNVEILESVAEGSIVTTVSAVDKDEGLNKLVRYSLKTTGNDSFSIAADTGIITTKKILDRETIPRYDLVVEASDQGVEESRSSSVVVVIRLKDVQDSKPVFEKRVYQFNVDENTLEQLGKVTATLADENFRNEMTYVLSKNTRHLFSIFRDTGYIQVSHMLDYEEQKYHILEVHAQVPSGVRDTCIVNVTVNDVNDHEPVLDDFYIFYNVKNNTFDTRFQVPATDVDVSSQLSYSILSGNEFQFVELDEDGGMLTLQKSILNTKSELQITFEVSDGRSFATAVGRITVSEVSKEMVDNSMFIILRNVTKDTFLTALMLKRFKAALATVFNCDSRKIFILSIEDFKHTDSSNTLPLLEVVVSVVQGAHEEFIPVENLKDMLYLNQREFEEILNITVLSFDYWNEYFCAAESCSNFQSCSVESSNTKSESTTIKSSNLIFRGIHVRQKLLCTCPVGYRDGPNSVNSCSEKFSLCYTKPCGDHGKCLSTDQDFTCVCDEGYIGKFCNAQKSKSICPGLSPIAMSSDPCMPNGKCAGVTGGTHGFTCQCDPTFSYDTDLCALSTRHFPKSSYVAVSGLQQRWNFSVSLYFATHEANAVLLYNGRYDDNSDFIALHIVDGQLMFSVSRGSTKGESMKVTVVKSFVPGGVNTGEWQHAKVLYSDQMIAIAVGESCDVNTAHLLNPEGDRNFCSSSKTIDSTMKSLDLSAPLIIGNILRSTNLFNVESADFVGCMKNIEIDQYRLDLASPLKDYKSQPHCPKQDFCGKQNLCREDGKCVNGLEKAYCECEDDFAGEFCEKDVKLSPPVSLNLISDLSIKPMKSTQVKPNTIMVKTTKQNGVIWEEEINSKKAYLKMSQGYPCYVYNSKLTLNLSQAFIADGKWHQIEVSWEPSRLTLSSDNKKFQTVVSLYQKFSSQTLLKLGGSLGKKFVGCLKSLSYGGNTISLVNAKNHNVKQGCSKETTCSVAFCGEHGACIIKHSSAECKCNDGFQGPKCLDICLTNPCLNDGACMRTTATLTGFKCLCPKNFTGDICETEIKSTCNDGYYGEPGSGLCGPCTCKSHKNFDHVCNKDASQGYLGQCFCKDSYYSVDGTCAPCNCLRQGSLTQTCNKQTGECLCKEGVIGRQCDRCSGAWQELRSKCNEINTSCPESFVERIWWQRIRPGETQVEDCPRGAIGNATRYCHERNSWGPANLFGCTSVGFATVKSAINNIDQQVLLDSRRVSDLASQLKFAVNIATRLYGKDIEIGNEALALLVAYEGAHSGPELVSSDDEKFVDNIVFSASRLFTIEAKNFWNSIQEKNPGTAGLMRELEKFLSILTENLAYVKHKRRVRRSLSTSSPLSPFSQASHNIFLELQPVNLNDGDTFSFPQQQFPWSSQFPVWKTSLIEITLANQMLRERAKLQGNQTNVGLIVYKTLANLLPKSFKPHNGTSSLPYKVQVYSDVFTLTIPGVSVVPEKHPLKIRFRNVTVTDPAVMLVCAFWNYTLENTISGGWSGKGCHLVSDNTSDITCECNHLTSFALIGIQYIEELQRIYQHNYLSYLGVAISCAVLLLCFIIFLCLGQLKSNSNSIHKNLIFAALLGELVFILAVNRPEIGESGCRIIAIIIHYFFTCTFAWLMVEALHMYRMILEQRDINYGQMMFYYFIGWGAPVMVVGVTAGLKPEGYGNSEFCWIYIKDPEILWTFFSPILVIIASNVLLTVVALFSSCEKQSDGKKERKVAAIRYRLLISLFFLPIISAMIVAGLIVVTYDVEIFLYIFPGTCLLTSLYILIFYTCLNRKVRKELNNAYIRKKTGDKTYGLKKKRPKLRPTFGNYDDERDMSRRYRATLQAFNIPTSSTTDSSDTDGRRLARLRIANSDTTDFQTTNNESDSDTSDEDDRGRIRRHRRPTIDSDSDSSDNSSGTDVTQPTYPNGKLGHSQQRPMNVEWKQASQKKLIKRTYASDGPVHSTPSESDVSDRQRYYKAGFTPTKVATPYLSAIHSESSENAPNEESSARRQSKSTTSSNDSDRSKPVSILKKKSKYDGGHKLRVQVKDSTRRPLMLNQDGQELNDSQV